LVALASSAHRSRYQVERLRRIFLSEELATKSHHLVATRMARRRKSARRRATPASAGVEGALLGISRAQRREMSDMGGDVKGAALIEVEVRNWRR
jgi:hypothetical protein